MADDLCDSVKNARLVGLANYDKTRDDGYVKFHQTANPRVNRRLNQRVIPKHMNV